MFVEVRRLTSSHIARTKSSGSEIEERIFGYERMDDAFCRSLSHYFPVSEEVKKDLSVSPLRIQSYNVTEAVGRYLELPSSTDGLGLNQRDPSTYRLKHIEGLGLHR